MGGGRVVRGPVVDGQPFDQQMGGWHCLQFSIWVSNSSICSVQSKKLYFLYILREASFRTVVVFAPGSVNKEHTHRWLINSPRCDYNILYWYRACRIHRLFSTAFLKPPPPIMSPKNYGNPFIMISLENRKWMYIGKPQFENPWTVRLYTIMGHKIIRRQYYSLQRSPRKLY